ncbi:hypothetical protein ACVXHB_12615 [Escherichia coli]
MMPTSYAAASAGREQMNEQTQAMCFMAGANSIFLRLQTADHANPEEDKDLQLFRKLGLNPQQTAVLAGDNEQQQRLEQALMTRTPTNITTRQHYELAGKSTRRSMRGAPPMPCVAVIRWREPDAGWWRIIASIATFPVTIIQV